MPVQVAAAGGDRGPLPVFATRHVGERDVAVHVRVAERRVTRRPRGPVEVHPSHQAGRRHGLGCLAVTMVATHPVGRPPLRRGHRFGERGNEDFFQLAGEIVRRERQRDRESLGQVDRQVEPAVAHLDAPVLVLQGLLHGGLAVQRDGVDPECVGELRDVADPYPVSVPEAVNTAHHPAVGVALAVGLQQRLGGHAALGGELLDRLDQRPGCELSARVDRHFGLDQLFPGARVNALHHGPRGLELRGRQLAARRDAELGQARPNPHQRALVHVHAVRNRVIGLGGGCGLQLFPVQLGREADPGGLEQPLHGGRLDPIGLAPGVDLPRHPAPDFALPVGSKQLRRVDADGGSVRPDRLDRGGRSDQRSVRGRAPVAARQAVFHLLVRGSDGGHPSHGDRPSATGAWLRGRGRMAAPPSSATQVTGMQSALGSHRGQEHVPDRCPRLL